MAFNNRYFARYTGGEFMFEIGIFLFLLRVTFLRQRVLEVALCNLYSAPNYLALIIRERFNNWLNVNQLQMLIWHCVGFWVVLTLEICGYSNKQIFRKRIHEQKLVYNTTDWTVFCTYYFAQSSSPRKIYLPRLRVTFAVFIIVIQ